MNKVEKKRQKEQYVVEEMTACTAGRTMEKRGMHPAGCVRNVRN